MGTNREKSLEGLNLLGHLCQPWLSTSNLHWPKTQTGYMVKNLNEEIRPVVAYARNLSSFFPYFHHKTSTYSDYLLFLKGWDYFHSTKKWLKFFMSQAEKVATFYWVKLEVHEAPWSQLSINTYSGTVMQETGPYLRPGTELFCWVCHFDSSRYRDRSPRATGLAEGSNIKTLWKWPTELSTTQTFGCL